VANGTWDWGMMRGLLNNIDVDIAPENGLRISISLAALLGGSQVENCKPQ
jgi:hypothetical protein